MIGFCSASRSWKLTFRLSPCSSINSRCCFPADTDINPSEETFVRHSVKSLAVKKNHNSKYLTRDRTDTLLLIYSFQYKGVFSTVKTNRFCQFHFNLEKEHFPFVTWTLTYDFTYDLHLVRTKMNYRINKQTDRIAWTVNTAFHTSADCMGWMCWRDCYYNYYYAEINVPYIHVSQTNDQSQSQTASHVIRNT